MSNHADDPPALPFLLPFLDLTGPTIETNLALDEALLIAAEEHGAGPVLRGLGTVHVGGRAGRVVPSR